MLELNNLAHEVAKQAVVCREQIYAPNQIMIQDVSTTIAFFTFIVFFVRTLQGIYLAKKRIMSKAQI